MSNPLSSRCIQNGSCTTVSPTHIQVAASSQSGTNTNPARSICYRVVVLPEFTLEGELPPGVHMTDWHDFQPRFGGSSLRRVWLLGRLRALLELAASNGKLRRIFI